MRLDSLMDLCNHGLRHDGLSWIVAAVGPRCNHPAIIPCEPNNLSSAPKHVATEKNRVVASLVTLPFSLAVDLVARKLRDRPSMKLWVRCGTAKTQNCKVHSPEYYVRT